MIKIDTKIFPKIRGAFLVGGSIRDMLCGRFPLDYDVVVVGNPDEFARQVALNTNGHLVEIGGKRGQAIIRVVAQKITIDVSKAKGASIKDDLRARDFTINAIAYDLYSQRLIDPLKGQKDLAQKIVRMVSNSVFNQDPVRLLRAFRIAAVLQFEIESHTKQAIVKYASHIQQSAGERIREELFKIFQSVGTHACISHLAETGLLFAILPELLSLTQCRQNRHHPFDAFEHTLRAYNHLERLLDDTHDQTLLAVNGTPLAQRIAKSSAPLLKFSILLHDIGKPAAQTVDRNQDHHFYGHQYPGAQMAATICRRLKISNHNADIVCFLVRHHMRPLFLYTALYSQNATQRAMTRFFMECEAHVPALVLLATADMLGKVKGQNHRDRAFIKFANQLLADFENDFKPKKSNPPLITGHDLINKFGLRPSPLFKEILNQVEEERLSRSDMTRQEAFDLLRELIQDQGST
jgi:poly(A) polymerase